MLETARALMIAASLPPYFWAKAVSTLSYLINFQPSAASQGGIPLERLFARSPDFFGSSLFWLRLLCSSSPSQAHQTDCSVY
jgi:hypothetical protein